jgi:hypothetical protein
VTTVVDDGSMAEPSCHHLVVRVWMEPDDPQLRGRVLVDDLDCEAERGVDRLVDAVRCELDAIEGRLRQSVRHVGQGQDQGRDAERRDGPATRR